MMADKARSLTVMVLALALATGACLALSIDSEPVKVTYRNSGPRYQLDEELDRPQLTPVRQSAPESAAGEAQPPPPPSSKPQDESEAGGAPADASDQTIPMGHISIRRIFLVPMARPNWMGGEEPAREEPRQEEPSSQEPAGAMFAKPFWPFLMAGRPAHPSHHLFGADEASRSPSPASRGEPEDFLKSASSSSAEREGDRHPLAPQHAPEPEAGPHRAMIDPIQMMIDLMQQAMSGQFGPAPNSPDLNKEASSSSSRGEPAADSQERPRVPAGAEPAKDESRQDIVEIEGKKYLRKTVISRHVGENIIFMTKRLIFVPVNETEPASSSSPNEQPTIPTSTTTSDLSEPAATTPAESTREDKSTPTGASEAPAESSSTTLKPPTEEATTTTTTTGAPTTTAATEPAPSSTTTTTTPTPTTTEQPTTTMSGDAAEPTTRAKESWVDRVSSAVEKAAERLTVGAAESSTTTTTTTTTTTEKPASS